MFKRIVSQLSLSPSAVTQLTFFGRRLSAEMPARSLAASAAGLLVLLQACIVLLPPVPANSAAPGDLIHGGFVSKQDLLNFYDKDVNLRAVYDYLGITRGDLATTTEADITSTDHSLKVLGRVGHAADANELTIGGQTYWMQPLYSADSGAAVTYGNTYHVLQGSRAGTNSYFAVIFRSGNIIAQTYPAPTATPVPSPSATPTPVLAAQTSTKTPVSCTALSANVTSGLAPLTVNFTGSGTAAAGQKISTYNYDFDDDTVATPPSPTISHTFDYAGNYQVKLQLKSAAGQLSPAAPACIVVVHVTSTPAVFVRDKSAVNITRNIDATTRPAQAGDVIKYHLSTKNVGGSTEAYTVVEHIEDILEYADVTDAGGGNLSGGVITWPAQAIRPGGTLDTTFTVRIKNPVPSVAVGVSDRNSYDLRLDNLYGDAVQIYVVPPTPKKFELASAALPPTGRRLSTGLIVAFGLIGAYFYLRQRQLLIEVKHLRGEYQGGA